jgi:hypothetical protein
LLKSIVFTNLDEHAITDKNNLVNRRNDSFAAVKKYAAIYQLNSWLPNTPAALETYSWMHFYFELVGDAAPT